MRLRSILLVGAGSGLVALAGVYFSMTSLLAAAGDLRHCADNGVDPAVRVQSCSTVLAGGRLSDEDVPVVLVNRGRGYRSLGRFGQAIADFDAALQRRPDYVSAYTNRGSAYGDRGDHGLAIADFRKAIALEPHEPPHYYSLGWVHFRNGDYNHAIAAYDQALRLDPELSRAYAGRGLAYNRKGDSEQAIANFDRALRLDGDYAVAYTGRGIAHFTRGDYDRALADYDQVIRLKPNDVSAYGIRGAIHFDRGDYVAAIADYDQVIRLDAAHGGGYRGRGLSQFYVGRFEAAAADWRRHLAAQPGDQVATLWLYLAQTRSGVDGKSELAQNARALDLSQWPGPVVQVFLGRLSIEGLDAEIAGDRERLAAALFYLGQDRLLVGDRDGAGALFRQVIELGDPASIEHRGAVAELARADTG